MDKQTAKKELIRIAILFVICLFPPITEWLLKSSDYKVIFISQDSNTDIKIGDTLISVNDVPIKNSIIPDFLLSNKSVFFIVK